MTSGDYDGVNEMILTDQTIDGKARKLLTHFDRNGFGYTLDRATGELLVAEKFDPVVNWATKVDMDKSSKTYVVHWSSMPIRPQHGGRRPQREGHLPRALGTKDEQPAAYSPETQLFYVPTNHVCMIMSPTRSRTRQGKPMSAPAVAMYPPKGDTNMGNFIAWDNKAGKIVWSNKEQILRLGRSVGDSRRRGLLRHA